MRTVDMTKGSPLKLLIQFSIPILIGNLFQQVYTLADRIIVGRFVGDVVHGCSDWNRSCGLTILRGKG